ncbi:MAG TPA: TetR/AcrR family transcriptional regulator [Anaerolineales bacterium]|nr:TetR/AcrR family transcriptional regulator [Anaerolineales bacterium]
MKQNPRQRRKEKNQANILDVATHLLITKGFDNVSLRDIAKHADYSPAGLYKLFDSKAAIIKAVLVRHNEILMERLEAVQSDPPHKQRLIQLCMEYIRFSLENTAYLILLNNLSSERSSKKQAIPANSPYRIFYQAVKDWIKSENIKVSNKYNVEEIAYALWAQIHGMATLRSSQLKNFEADFESADQLTIEIYLYGIKNWEQK